jgi:vacuolar-type H+-ATPase subunit I/STV1
MTSEPERSEQPKWLEDAQLRKSALVAQLVQSWQERMEPVQMVLMQEVLTQEVLTQEDLTQEDLTQAAHVQAVLRRLKRVQDLTRVERVQEAQLKRRDDEGKRLEHARSAHFLLTTAARLMPRSERDRYLEEFLAELLDIPPDTRLSHALSLLRGVFVLRLRRGLKNKAADATARRVKD